MRSCRQIVPVSYPENLRQLDWKYVVINSQEYLQALLEFKKHHHLNHIILPLNDEPFYRGLGLELSYDWNLGIRINQPATNQRPKAWDMHVIRVYQEVIHALVEKDIPVTLQVSGLFSALSNWIPLEDLILMTRKDPIHFEKIMNQMCYWIIQWLNKMSAAGVGDFYYTDAVGGADIVGPRFYGQILGPWTYRLLCLRQENKPMLLCPRTFLSLNILDVFEENLQGQYHQSLCSSDSLNRPRVGSYHLKERREYYD